MSLREELQSFFGSATDRRVVIVGIGSPMRHDDVVGLVVIKFLDENVPNNVLLLSTETVPESYTGVIRDFKPTHVILVDAADFRGKPGEARIVSPEAIANRSVSTHSLPLNVLIGYIKRSICEKVILLGIQCVNIDFGKGLSPEVESGAKETATLLSIILN